MKNGVFLNYVVTFFFFENAKNLASSDDGKRREKKEDGLTIITGTKVFITVYVTVLWYNFIPIWKLGLTGNTHHEHLCLFNALKRK